MTDSLAMTHSLTCYRGTDTNTLTGEEGKKTTLPTAGDMDLEEDDPVGDGEGWAWSPGRGEGLGLTPGSALSGLLSSLGDFPPPSCRMKQDISDVTCLLILSV